MSETDGVTPEAPGDEGLDEPTLPIEDIEGARLLANDARARLRGDGFDDDEIDGWARVYFEQDHEGDADGLVAFIQAEQAAGRSRPS